MPRSQPERQEGEGRGAQPRRRQPRSAATDADRTSATRAIEYAIALVAARSRTEKNLRDKLATRYDDPPIEAAMERMRELGLVDDAAWAERFARDSFERLGKGRHRIRNELLARGIDPATAEASLGEVLSEESERARAVTELAAMRERLERGGAASKADGHAPPGAFGQTPRESHEQAARRRNRLFRRMLARGYPASLVRDLLEIS